MRWKWVASGLLFAFAACQSTSDTTGAGGAGGDGSGGGDECACTESSECEAPESPCLVAACNECACEAVPADEGAACGDGKQCDGEGACVGELGVACEESAECQSGFCADGVCCDAACEGPCQACDVAGEEGACTPAAAASEPENGCDGGVCDGAGMCAVGESQWIALAPSDGMYAPSGVAATADGGVIVAAEFSGTFSVGDETHVGAGDFDSYVARFASDGSVEWVRWIGSADAHDSVLDVTTFANGDVMVAGSFEGTTDFGGGPISKNSTTGFLARYDSDGKYLSSELLAADIGVIAAVESLHDGGYVVAGVFAGGLSLTDPPVFVGENPSVFVARFDADGEPVWSDHLRAYPDERIRIAVDGDGNVAVGFASSGPIALAEVPYGPQGAAGVVLAYDGKGKRRWARIYDKAGMDTVQDVAYDSEGNLLVTGYYFDEIDFGDGHSHTSKGPTDIFVAKLAGNSGEPIWSSSFGADGIQFGFGVSVDERDNVLLTGTGGGTFDFGGDPIDADSNGFGYVVKLARDGAHLWTRPLVAQGFAYAYDVTSSGGSVLAHGVFQGDLYFKGKKHEQELSGFVVSLGE